MQKKLILLLFVIGSEYCDGQQQEIDQVTGVCTLELAGEQQQSLYK